MADWTTITDTAIDPDAPVTSELAYAWRDNPIAITEGAAGAPRVWIGALQRLTVGGAIRSRIDAQQGQGGAGSGGSLDVYRFGFMQVGNVRLALEQQGASSSILVIRTRGGANTNVQTWGGSGGWVARSVDFAVLPGDLITVQLNWVSDIGLARNIRLSTGGEDLWPGIPAPLEGNTYA